jgi:hypothetical protein
MGFQNIKPDLMQRRFFTGESMNHNRHTKTMDVIYPENNTAE